MSSEKYRNPPSDSIKISVIPSSSSRKSGEQVRKDLEDPKYTQWGPEVPKATEPYRNRLFEIPYKPPRNECRHLGGLGVHKPRFRSKIHPSRPTTLQQLHRQRTGNRVNFSLTEEPSKARESIPKRVEFPESAQEYVNQVVYADNLDSPKSPRSLSPTPSSTSSSHHKTLHSTSIRQITSLLKQGPLLKVTQDPIEDFLTTKRRASAQGLLQNMNDLAVDKDSPRDNDILDFLSHLKSREGTAVDPKKLSTTKQEVNSDIILVKQKPKCKLVKIDCAKKSVTGALFGPHLANRGRGVATKLSEKFLLPKAMVDRLAKRNTLKSSEAHSQRKSMRGHMKKPFPGSDSSSEDEKRDDLEEVKSLTLIRTGYCTIPKIVTGKRRRKDRLKTNRFLNKQQLNRIRYLFFDERKKWAPKKEVDLDKQPPPFVAARQREMNTKVAESAPRSEQSFDHGKQKTILKLKKFLTEYRKNKEFEGNKGKSLTFKGFSQGLLDQQETAEEQKESDLQEMQFKKVSWFSNDKEDYNRKALLRKLKIAQPPKLFKQSRAKQSFRGIDARDGQYIDPNFMIKQRNPELAKKKKSQYTLQSTSRYHTKLRDRLQVNTVDYEDERFGFGDQQFLQCLATEWDENFVNELEATKKFKKFQVKTDIIRMREVIRKNFNAYYILENLANLRHKQRHEENFIDNMNRFAEMCTGYLEKMKVSAYDSLISKTNQLKPMDAATQTLVDQEKSLRAKLEHVTEALLGIEQRWDTIMRLQNYYYALMSTDWRKRNDWIHRNPSTGDLEVAIYSVDRCRTANIRDKADEASGFAIIAYFGDRILPNLEQMRGVKPDLALLKKGLHSMQSEVFLNQYNKTLSLYDAVTRNLQAQTRRISDEREAKQRHIHFLQRRQEFIEERNHVLQYEANQITNKPLEEAIKNFQMRRAAAVCNEMYRNVMPLQLRRPEIDKDLDTIAKFSRMHQYVMDVLHELDKLPVAVLKFTETRTRQQRRKVLEEGRAAVVKQTRFELLQKQLRGFFSRLQPSRESSHAPQSIGNNPTTTGQSSDATAGGNKNEKKKREHQLKNHQKTKTQSDGKAQK